MTLTSAKEIEIDTCHSEDNMKIPLGKLKSSKITFMKLKVTLVKAKAHKSESWKNSLDATKVRDDCQ